MTIVNARVRFKGGGDQLAIEDGGQINVEPGGTIKVDMLDATNAIGALVEPGYLAKASTTITLAANDRECLKLTNAAAITLTIPLHATVPLRIGARRRIVQGGAGQITVAGETGAVTLIYSASATLVSKDQGSVVELHQIDTDIWLVTGNLVAA